MRFTRYILAILFAILMTFCLFYLMQSLVMGTRSVNRSDVASVVVDFSRTVEESDTHTKDRRLPDKAPAAPELPPVAPAVNVSKSSRMALKQPLPFRAMAPSMIEGLAVAGSPAELGGIPQDTEAFPLVRMEPRYPRRALQRGIEGFVDLEFTISETGNVEDARVVNAEPGHIFDGAALRAIKKWKYKPMVVDGKPVKRHGVTVTLEFELEE